MPVILMEAPRDVGIGIRRALLKDFPRIMEIERLALRGSGITINSRPPWKTFSW